MPTSPSTQAPAPLPPPRPTTQQASQPAPAPTGEEVSVEVQEQQGAEYEPFPWGAMAVILVAVGLSYLLFRLTRLTIAERVKRWAPLLHLCTWVGALLGCGTLLIRQGSLEWLAFGVILLCLVVVLNLNWLRSVLSGVALALEGHLDVGDAVRVDDFEGDVVHFGMRATRIRALDGTLHDVPNEHLMVQHVANLSGDGSDSACIVQIIVPKQLKIKDASALALQEAMLSPLASPRHRPEVFLQERLMPEDPLRLHIKGYAFDPNYQEHFRSDVLTRVMRRFERRTGESRIQTADGGTVASGGGSAILSGTEQ